MASVLKDQQKRNESKQFMIFQNPLIKRKPLIWLYWISLKHLIKILHKRLIDKLNYYGISGSIATRIETSGRKWGNIPHLVYHSYLRCRPTSGNRSWAATRFFLYINDLPTTLHTRQPIHMCRPMTLCRLLYFICRAYTPIRTQNDSS